MGELNFRDCLVFLDDILIFLKIFDEYFDRLIVVFERFEKYCLKFKVKKCEFLKKSVIYFGYVVSDVGVVIDFEKIKVIIIWLVFYNIKILRIFLGFVGYYRRYV